MINIQNLSYTYPGSTSPVINNVTLNIQEGEFVALLGANGSGKSTLLRSLNGLIQPTTGHVQIDTLSTQTRQDISLIRQKVGLVFQNPDDQIIASTVEREIAFGLENLGILPEEMHQRVEQTLQQFQLKIHQQQDPNQLSGGERQRLALASIIVMHPKYLLLDEPTSLLDPSARANILSYLHHLHKEKEITPILVTQIPSEAAQADRIIVLNQGQVALDGAPAEIFAQIDTLKSLGLHPPLATHIAHNINLPTPYPLTIEELSKRIRLPQKTPQTSPTQKEPTSAPIISAQALSHIYNPKLPTQTTALDHLNTHIYPGEITTLIGTSGSGKSTFIQHLNGLLKPTSGTLTVCDLDTNKNKDLITLRRHVGLIFQFPEAQLFAETVFEDVAFGPQNLQLSDIPTRVHDALQMVGLDPKAFEKRDPLRLSGGEKRRVAIAGILAMEPEIIIFDEPTAGLDPVGASLIENLILVQKSQGRTIVMITHDLDLAARIADRIYVFQKGQVIKNGPPAEMLSSHILLPLGLHPPEGVHLFESLRKKSDAIPHTCITPETLIAFLTGNSP
ncbi:MAG: ATP-binding cassette domain-containing protein [Candidatus Latescibacteria bacterium]|nr:ATP-binding cassette domain-containing protein [Candidatus Latescibacterota bacterium]